MQNNPKFRWISQISDIVKFSTKFEKNKFYDYKICIKHLFLLSLHKKQESENMSPKIIQKLRIFFESEPIEKAWIFGSYARGEETSESDVDILVRYTKNTCLGLFGISALIEKLEHLLEKKVDLVDEDSLYPRVAKIVNAEKIQIYERNS